MEKLKSMIKLPSKDTLRKIYKKSPVTVVDLFVYVMLILMAFVFLYPFFYMIITSLKSYNDLINVTVKWIPKEITLNSYKTAISVLKLDRTFVNSMIVSCLSTVGHVFACSFIAYGFARFDFPLKKVFFAIVILSILVPVQVIIVPQYITYTRMAIHIGDFVFEPSKTYLPLILPCFLGFGLKGGLFVFLYRQYFLGIPKSLEEAASIDGCGPFKTFFRIAFPSAGSTTIVCIVLSFVWHWNDYYEPGIYLSSAERQLLPQIVSGIKALISAMAAKSISGDIQDLLEQGLMYHDGISMAGTVISIIPPMIVYLILQRKFMEGIERSGLTGM